MKDNRYKYVEITKAFPDRAGRLAQTLTTLKRLIQKQVSYKHTSEMEALLITASEAIDIGFEFNEWTKEVWTEVLRDYQDLEEVAKLKNLIQDQAETIQYYEKLSRRDKKTA